MPFTATNIEHFQGLGVANFGLDDLVLLLDLISDISYLPPVNSFSCIY
jgi:hypothetical protein